MIDIFETILIALACHLALLVGKNKSDIYGK